MIPESDSARSKGRHSIAYFVHPDNLTPIVPLDSCAVSSSSTEEIDGQKVKTRKKSFKNAKMKWVDIDCRYIKFVKQFPSAGFTTLTNTFKDGSRKLTHLERFLATFYLSLLPIDMEFRKVIFNKKFFPTNSPKPRLLFLWQFYWISKHFGLQR